MIPKIIHYCWFGGKEKPESVLAMIRSWKEYLPEYEIREWNESNFDVQGFSAFTREAYATRNYAHVSDVARLKALYDCGGIYLDTDVEVVGSFDPFLGCRSFCSAEHRFIGTGAIGAEKGSEWLYVFLNHYKSAHFITLWGGAKQNS